MLIADEGLSREVHRPRSHLPVVIGPDIDDLLVQPPPALDSFGEIIFQQFSTILQEEDVCNYAFFDAVVNWLVCLVVLHIIDCHYLL